jgi:hypothetical protein
VAIRLPNLATTPCKGMIVCGEVQTDDPRLLGWMAKQENLSARYGPRGEVCFVQAVFGGGEDGKSLHLDVTSRDLVKGKLPPATDKVGDIQEATSRLEGQKIDAQIEGYFFIPKAEVPPVIRSAMVKTKAGNVTITAVRGTFFVRGAPIQMIDWSLLEDEDILVRLAGQISVEIGEDYLELSLKLLNSAFEALVHGGRQNVRR